MASRTVTRGPQLAHTASSRLSRARTGPGPTGRHAGGLSRSQGTLPAGRGSRQVSRGAAGSRQVGLPNLREPGPQGAQPGSRLLPAPALAPRQPLLPSVVPPAPPSSSPLSRAFTPHARRLARPRAQGYGGRNKSDTHPALKKTPPGRQDQKVNQQLPHKGPGPSGQAGTDGLEHH